MDTSTKVEVYVMVAVLIGFVTLGVYNIYLIQTIDIHGAIGGLI